MLKNHWLGLVTALVSFGSTVPLAAQDAEPVAPEVQVPAADQLFEPMRPDQARTATLDWVAAQKGVTDAQQTSVAEVWKQDGPIPTTAELHDRAIRSFGIVSSETQDLLVQCRIGSSQVPVAELLAKEGLDSFYESNLRAHVGRYLSQSGFADEALDVFAKVDAGQLIDPASFLFYKAVAEHSLLKRDEGLATLKQLLENSTDVPVRYSTVAELMKTDLEKLKEKTLDEIHRMMSDVERRLGHGRGGERVQKKEDEIVERLDELIDKLEKQRQQQQQQMAQAQGKDGKANPADDSRIKGSTAPGEVDERDIGERSGWGSLPPKQQTRAKNLIDRELPPHYRNAIEQYLRKLAKRPAAQK
jgi:tetratricopeptide (TPR) repeat protein